MCFGSMCSVSCILCVVFVCVENDVCEYGCSCSSVLCVLMALGMFMF